MRPTDVPDTGQILHWLESSRLESIGVPNLYDYGVFVFEQVIIVIVILNFRSVKELSLELDGFSHLDGCARKDGLLQVVLQS